MGSRWRLLSVCITLVILTSCTGELMTLREGERIIFLGDSITQQGIGPTGYVTLVRKELAAHFPDLALEVIGAGISGNKVTDLQARLSRDVIDKKPGVVVIYIGINDVWHWTMPNHVGTTKEEFESGLKEIIARIQYAGAEVILCTPTVIGEKKNGANAQDSTLDVYCEISRKVAHALGARLCDLRKTFLAHLAVHNENNAAKGILTVDGVHLNEEGNKVVARELLQFFTHP